MAGAASRLSARTVFGFGIGDFAFNLFWSTTSLYLLFFYTDVLGLNATTAGLIILICLVWDGVTDPAMGAIASRVRTRWGRYRPFVLFGAPLTALSFWLMFTSPGFAEGWPAAWALVTHLLFRTAYTIQSIPYSSLSAVITTDSEQRGRLAAARMVSATISGLLVAFFTLKLAAAAAPDRAQGFALVTGFYALASLLIFAFTFANTREQVLPPAAATRPGVRDLTRLLAGNRAFLLLFGATLLSSVGGTLFSKTLVYYVIYVLKAPDAVGGLLAALIGTITVFVPIWQAITRRTSKRFVWICGSALTATAWTIWFLVPPATTAAALPFLVAGGIASAAFYLTFWSMLPDTIEYGLFKTGVRAESLQFGLISLSQKVALGLGVGLLGLLLDLIGYRANESQSPDTIEGLLAVLTLLPAGLSALSGALMLFYPVDAALHARLVKVLAWRERRGSAAAASG